MQATSWALPVDPPAECIVEWSEAQAYAALIRAAPQSLKEQFALSSPDMGQTTALIAGGYTSNLVLNRVIGLGSLEAATVSELDNIDAWYRAAGVSTYAIELSPAANPADLPDWLRDRSFMPFKQTSMMIRRCEPFEPAASALRVQRASTAQAAAFVALCCGVFGHAGPIPDLLSASFGSPNWQHWLAFDRDEPVAAAITHLWADTAWIGWVCTRPEHRGRGAQSLLAAAQLRGAAEVGARHATLEAATGTRARPGPSLRNYGRLGWTVVHDRLTYVKRTDPGA